MDCWCNSAELGVTDDMIGDDVEEDADDAFDRFNDISMLS